MATVMAWVMMMSVMRVKSRRVAGTECLENVKVLGKVLSPREDNFLVVFKGVDGNK